MRAHSIIRRPAPMPRTWPGSSPDFGAWELISTDNMPDRKDILGDTTRPKKYAPLTFMAALLAVFSFAAPAMAATMDCVAGEVDIVCTYDASGEGSGNPALELYNQTISFQVQTT